MEHLLFAAYLVLFAWLVPKIKFFKNSGLTAPQLIIFFLLKVIAGIFYGWIGVYYGEMAQMVDTWAYHYESLKDLHLLKTDPSAFFSSLFQNNYPTGYANFLISKNSWWNDLKANSFILIMTFFNLLSFGNYYTNVIFYSFVTLFGPIAVYRIMADIYPKQKVIVLLATFLIPSFLYWTSGLHKEGIIFTGLAIVIYNLYFGFKTNKFTLSRIIGILFGFFLIITLRNFLIIPLIPAIIAWLISEKTKWKPITVFICTYLIFICIFFGSKYLHGINLPDVIVIKQKEFLMLEGGSSVPVNELKPEFSSFIINLPQALALSTLRPYPSDVRHLLSLAASIEITLLIALFLVFLFIREKGHFSTPFLLFCIAFSFSVLIMIGYTVNILGAIVRYRSIILPLLIIPISAKINWSKIRNYLINNIINKNNI